MSEPLVVAEELEREYRMGPELVRVLRGVSLTVNAGESVAIIGASGVGKSTLLHLLGTLDRPTGGRVLFDGEDVSTRTDAALARLRRTEVGFIFQFYNLLGEMTALENAMLPALLQRASVVLTPDAGPAHIASALGTPVIGIYAATWSRRSGPYNSLDLCVDRYEEAARKYRNRKAAELRWGHRIEEPGVMDLVRPADVIERLEAFSRDPRARVSLPA